MKPDYTLNEVLEEQLREKDAELTELKENLAAFRAYLAEETSREKERIALKAATPAEGDDEHDACFVLLGIFKGMEQARKRFDAAFPPEERNTPPREVP